jgi:molecular chaperone HtpG
MTDETKTSQGPTPNDDAAQAAASPPAEPSPPAGAVEMPFQAEVQQVLGLVIHSLYANTEVFLRELVSNASDALDRGRFLQLTRSDVTAAEGELGISIRLDETTHTLTLSDNGIGMTRDEVVQNLGTIARSGSLEFLKAHAEATRKEKDGALKLIGQFGVGFYAAFMVASRVDVQTRSMLPGAEPVLWRSTGSGTFTVLPGERQHPGTEITLHLKPEHREYAQPWRVKAIIEKYSDFVTFPIRVGDELVNRQKALWAMPKGEITEEQHTEFYRHVSGHVGDEPLARVHLSIDAPVQFQALLYVPGKAPYDLFQKDRRGIKLYAKRILIDEDSDKLTPIWLRFLRGVVDSEDLSLNVSREMLQENKTLASIEQQITKQVLKALKDLSESNKDRYATFWKEFGRVLKEGLTVDWRNKDAIVELCRFESMRTEPTKTLSLAEYVAAMPEAQQDIFYVTGLSRKQVAESPHLEAFKKRGWDVLFLVDPIDEWVVQSLPEHAGKKLKSVTHGELDLGPEPDASTPGGDAPKAIEAVKKALGDRVKDVRVTRRLTDSASCLVAADGDPGANMERILRMVDEGAVQQQKRILELNPGHPIVQNLEKLAERAPESPRVQGFAELLFDQAMLAEGVVEDPANLVRRIQALLTDASAAAVAAGQEPSS